MSFPCETCGISKEELKSEILNEIMPIITERCMGLGRRAADFDGPSDPIVLDVGYFDEVRPNYASSAGVLDREIRDMQQQIDRNYADIMRAKEIYEREVDYLLETASLLERSTKMLEDEMHETKQEQEKQEMYGRRNILQVDEYEERDGENTNQIFLRMCHAIGLKNVSFKDICRSHRNGRRRRGGGPRPIYVKLVSHDLKDEVMKRKNLLRKIPDYKHVFVNENLTSHRRWLYKCVREEVGNRNCQTYDGTIYVKNLHGNMPFKIDNIKDFFYVFNKYPKKDYL